MNNQFKALNDVTRREILNLLKGGDLSAGEIAEQFDMAKPSISHHLDILKNADFVSSKKNGQYVIYTLNTTIFEEIMSWMVGFMSKDNENEGE